MIRLRAFLILVAGLLVVGQVAALAATVPSILSQPKGGSASAGEAFNFDVLPGGDGPFTYQWFFNGLPLSGETNLRLQLTDVSVADAGLYSVGVTNLEGGLMSSAATLTVEDPISLVVLSPVSLTNPDSVTTFAGEAVEFGFLAGGTAPIQNQWYLDDAPLSGQTNLLLQLTNVSGADTGAYSVGVSRLVGVTNLTDEVFSSSVALTVTDPLILTNPVSVAMSPGATAIFQVFAGGTGPFEYQWFFENVLIGDQTNSVLLLPRVSGTNSGHYTVEVSNMFGEVTSAPATLTVGDPRLVDSPVGGSVMGGESFTFEVLVEGTQPIEYQWRLDGVELAGETNSVLTLGDLVASQSGDYTVTATNASGGLETFPATLVVADPVILTQPVGGSARGGETFAFTVEAAGTPPLSYQWNLGGVPVSGATSSTLTLSGVSSADAGAYSVTVANISGSVTSLVANLTVADPVITRQPVGDTVAGGSNFTNLVTVASSAPVAYRWFHEGTEISGATNASLVLTSVTNGNAGRYTVEVSNSSGTVTVTSVPADLVVVELKITKQPQGGWLVAGEDFTTSVEVFGRTNLLSYQWFLGETPLVGETKTNLVLSGVTTNDAGGYAVMVSNVTKTGMTNVVMSETAYVIVFDPVIRKHPTNGTALAGSNFDFKVMADGTGPFTYQWFFDGVELPGETSSNLTLVNVSSADAGFYSVGVTNVDGGGILSRVATLTVVDLAILNQPVDQSALAGSSVTFDVAVEGLAPFSYQWRLRGTELAGETHSSLVLTGLTAEDGGNYSVVVSNATGRITSRDAVLTVLDPIILEPPVQGGFAGVGEDFSFVVSADGTQPMIYQWLFNGSAVPGEVLETLHLTDLEVADSGSYSVEVRNAAGTMTSVDARLTVTTGTPRSVATGKYISTGYQSELEILLEGNGNEKGLSFSIAYDPMIISNPDFIPTLPATYTVYTDTNFPGVVGVEVDLTSGTFLRTNQQTVGTLSFDIMYDSDILQSKLEFVDGFIPTEARDLQDRSLALATELKPSGILIDPVPTYDLVSGLFIQRLLLSNPTASPDSNVIVDVYGLGDDSLGREIFLFNGETSNFTDPGRINQLDSITDSAEIILPAGSFTVVTMEYFASDRMTVPTPQYEYFFGFLLGSFAPSGGDMVNIVQAKLLDEGRFLIEFPTAEGHEYFVQYSDKLSEETVFTTSFPSVLGTGGTVRWIDSGAPRTADHVTSLRCYRVLRAP